MENNREANGGSEDSLQKQKLQLEMEKLREDIETARYSRRWIKNIFRNVKANEWLLVVGGILAVGIAYYTGIIDLKKERLANEQAVLELRKDQLTKQIAEYEQREAQLNAQVAVNNRRVSETTQEIRTKTKQLDALKHQLEPYEKEDRALQSSLWRSPGAWSPGAPSYPACHQFAALQNNGRCRSRRQCHWAHCPTRRARGARLASYPTLPTNAMIEYPS